MIEALWYRCENDYCLRYRVLTDVYPGEEAVCAECGEFMHAADAPPGYPRST